MATVKRNRSSRKRGKSLTPRAHARADGSFGEWLHYLLGTTGDWDPTFPTDVFGITAAFLRRTGAYIEHEELSRDDTPSKVGEAWRNWLDELLGDYSTKPKGIWKQPNEIYEWWSAFASHKHRSFDDVAGNPAVKQLAWNLCVAADAACAGIGISPMENKPFLAYTQYALSRNKRLSFCFKIPPEKLAVLAKQHTPQRGCTIRSISHHLSLYTPSEIRAEWWGPQKTKSGPLDVLNVLLLPWPLEVETSDFEVMPGHRSHSRYFKYAPKKSLAPKEFAKKVKEALKCAKEHAHRIHAIVLPELALTEAQFKAIEKVAAVEECLLIAGVRSAVRDNWFRNYSVLQPIGLTRGKSVARDAIAVQAARLAQPKHHRWCLDRSQILQYGLGGRLPASHDCWERMKMENRSIHFVTLEPWLTICTLICEDLARQDPISDVLRAVGPNLIFALLMDGPQVKGRWSSRYAHVLAEDPGCSVLSLTSLGMSRRMARPPTEGPDRTRVIGLWRDAIDGERELELMEEGHDACVLSLVKRSLREHSLDGRHDHEKAHFPVFAGFKSFRCGV